MSPYICPQGADLGCADGKEQRDSVGESIERLVAALDEEDEETSDVVAQTRLLCRRRNHLSGRRDEAAQPDCGAQVTRVAEDSPQQKQRRRRRRQLSATSGDSSQLAEDKGAEPLVSPPSEPSGREQTQILKPDPEPDPNPDLGGSTTELTSLIRRRVCRREPDCAATTTFEQGANIAETTQEAPAASGELKSKQAIKLDEMIEQATSEVFAREIGLCMKRMRLDTDFDQVVGGRGAEQIGQDKTSHANVVLQTLQRISRRRDELRLIDKQLNEIMAECVSQLQRGPPQPPCETPPQATRQEDAIDLTLSLKGNRQLCSSAPATSATGSVNLKKMRLLGLTAPSCVATNLVAAADCGTQMAAAATTTLMTPPADEPQAATATVSSQFFANSQQTIERHQLDDSQQVKRFRSASESSASLSFAASRQQLQQRAVSAPQSQLNSQLASLFARCGGIENSFAAPLDCLQQWRNIALSSSSSSLSSICNGGGNFECNFAAAPTRPHQVASAAQLCGGAQQLFGGARLAELDTSSGDKLLAAPLQLQPLPPPQLPQANLLSLDDLVRETLARHQKLLPIVERMAYKCHVCQSGFEDKHRLQQHLSIHLDLHPSWFEEKTIKETMAQYEMRRGDYLCTGCQARFDTTAEFDKHMQLHGEKPHHCELCQQESNKTVSFRFFRQLLTHLRSHCFLYTCRFVPECKQTANRKDYLKLHILKHHLKNKLPEQHTFCCH